MTNIWNIITAIIFSVAAGGFFFRDDDKVLAIICIVAAFLFAIGYFDPDRVEKGHKKSVM